MFSNANVRLGCDCDCGGPQDPDCLDQNSPLYNCGDPSAFKCEDGSCTLINPPPSNWIFCSDLWYGTNDGTKE